MAKRLAVRIDDRLIHGQVVTQWVNIFKADHIIVIDDQVAADKMQKSILKFAAPPDIKVSIYSSDKAAEQWQKNQFGKGSVFVLFKQVGQIEKTADLGIVFDEITIGQMAVIGERKQIYKQVGLSKVEAETLLDLEKRGIKLSFQMIPTDKKIGLQERIRKVFPDLL